MRSCSRKKYRPTIVPVKCPRNPLATGFPLAAFRSLLRREPRDFSSSGGTGVINDLRIENPWNENREHHARIRATCACDRLRIEKGRRGEEGGESKSARTLTDPPIDSPGTKNSFPPWNDHCTFHVSYPPRQCIRLEFNRVDRWSCASTWPTTSTFIDRILNAAYSNSIDILLPSIKDFVLRLDLHIYIYISRLLLLVNQGSCS